VIGSQNQIRLACVFHWNQINRKFILNQILIVSIKTIWHRSEIVLVPVGSGGVETRVVAGGPSPMTFLMLTDNV
jgi:hypothetical protein